MANETVFTNKEQALISVSASIAAGCQPCTEYHVNGACRAGACDQSVALAIETALAVRESATRNMEAWADRCAGTPPELNQEFRSDKRMIAELAAVAAATAVNSVPDVLDRIQRSRQAGATEEQILAAVALAASIRGTASQKLEAALGEPAAKASRTTPMSAQGATAPGRPPCRAILEAVSRAGAYNKERGTIDAVPMTAGDKPYFEALYREFHPRVLRYLARLIGFDEAEDAAQEVFAKISRALPEFRNESQVPTWIYRIATNTATDRVRTPEYRLKVRSPPIEGSCEAEPAAVPIASTECSAERQTIRDEMSGCVQGLLAELPDDYRTVLVLSEMEHLKDREIAEGSNAASIATARTRWFATSSRSLQNPDLPDSIFSCAFLVPTAKQEIPCR